MKLTKATKRELEYEDEGLKLISTLQFFKRTDEHSLSFDLSSQHEYGRYLLFQIQSKVNESALKETLNQVRTIMKTLRSIEDQYQNLLKDLQRTKDQKIPFEPQMHGF